MSESKRRFDFGKMMKSQLALPIIALLVMLVVNVIIIAVTKQANFFKVSINNGVLYGYIIDILNRSSELVILAVGMTLVAASSRGTDISVGAVAAISGALIVRLLGSSYDSYAMVPVLAIFFGLLASAACGAFNGLLVARLNIQPMIATLILFWQRHNSFQRGHQLIQQLSILNVQYIGNTAQSTPGGFAPHLLTNFPSYHTETPCNTPVFLRRFYAI